ncbi:MAG: glutathionylspermidine synthase family protein [Campylobacterales bacterium]|nr:glutathionylspermidine synthase family protein [Campylobacterales bacterium]
MNIIKLKPLTKEYLESIGFSWHTDLDNRDYISQDIVQISEEEAQNFYDAANELYDMYVQAAQHVIENNLFHELSIPFNLVQIIKDSWENDVHWHLYGRFDLAGGFDGTPIKLIEFNADTPTSLFETMIIQWALLKYNNLDETRQFNSLYEALIDNFKRIITLNEDIEKFEEYYSKLGWKILFSCIKNNEEELHTTKLLQHIASEAGFETNFAYIDEVEFGDEGISIDDQLYEFWFKLIPWEDIAIQEGELALRLTQMIEDQKVIIFNPAYTLLFQSKGMLKILWDLFPHHPLLLQTSYEPLENLKQVEKPMFGREGANVAIVNQDNSLLVKNDGPYESNKMVYQEYYEFPKDLQGQYYQAGVFYSYEACGLGLRKGNIILDNFSKFVPHIVK